MNYDNFENDDSVSLGGGFESFDNGNQGLPPVQMTQAYHTAQTGTSKVVPIIIGVLVALLLIAGVLANVFGPYLAFRSQSKRLVENSYSYNMTMNISGLSQGNVLGNNTLTAKGVKGKEILSMNIASAQGGYMNIYMDLHDPNHMVIDIKPLFETMAKNLGSYGISFDQLCQKWDTMAFSGEQMMEVWGSQFDVNQFSTYESDLNQAADLKTLFDQFKYVSKPEKDLMVLGEDAYYFELKSKELTDGVDGVAYIAIPKNKNRNQLCVVSGVEGVVSSLTYNYSFGAVEEPVMPDISGNEEILNYLKKLLSAI